MFPDQLRTLAPLNRSFYGLGARNVAEALLNCTLIRETDDGVVAGRISETEAYTQSDEASHSFRGRTRRNQVMFGPCGYAYVYFTYGMHHCFNVVTAEEGDGEAVLIRAIEPLYGMELMRCRRGLSNSDDECDSVDPGRTRCGKLLGGGPARLCKSFGIDLSLNGADLTLRSDIWIAEPIKRISTPIVATKRIGISRNRDLMHRFVLQADRYNSRTAIGITQSGII